MQPSHTLATEPCRSTFEATAIATGRPMVITRCSVTQMISSRLQQPARNHQHSLEHLSVDSRQCLPSQRSPDQGAHRLQVASCSSTWPRESKRPDGSRFKNLCARACVVSTVLMKQPMPLRSTTPSSTSKRFVGVEKEPSSTRRRALVLALGPTIRQRAK